MFACYSRVRSRLTNIVYSSPGMASSLMEHVSVRLHSVPLPCNSPSWLGILANNRLHRVGSDCLDLMAWALHYGDVDLSLCISWISQHWQCRDPQLSQWLFINIDLPIQAWLQTSCLHTDSQALYGVTDQLAVNVQHGACLEGVAWEEAWKDWNTCREHEMYSTSITWL